MGSRRAAPRQHDVVATDCGMLHGPPNTLLAARRAISDGATALNIDLVLTSDERLVGVHSSTHWDPLGRLPIVTASAAAPTATPVAAVSSMRLREIPQTPSCHAFRQQWRAAGVPECHLRRLRACARQPVSTLEDFLDAFPLEVSFYVDLKAHTHALQERQRELLEGMLSAGRHRGRRVAVRFFSSPALVAAGNRTARAGPAAEASALRLMDAGLEQSTCAAAGSLCHSTPVALRRTLGVLSASPFARPASTVSLPWGAYVPSSVLRAGWTPHREWAGLLLVCDMAVDYLAPGGLAWREAHAASACQGLQHLARAGFATAEHTPLPPALAGVCAKGGASLPRRLPAMLLL